MERLERIFACDDNRRFRAEALALLRFDDSEDAEDREDKEGSKDKGDSEDGEVNEAEEADADERITKIRTMIKMSEGAKIGFARTRYPKDIGA